MKDLKEIILVLEKHNVHPLKYMAPPGDNKSKLLALYEGIARNRFSSDEVAAASLYSTDSRGSSYRKLKSDLREKLLDAMLQINTDLEQYTDYQRAYYHCHKQWLIVRFLTGQNANTAALLLANRLLRQVEKYDFTLLGIDLTSYLRTQYGLRESNDKRFVEANQLFDRYHKIYAAESLAEELYSSLIVRVVNSRSAQEALCRTAVEYYARLEPALLQHQSYKLNMYAYMIGLIRFTTVNDHEQALPYCEKAIQFFQARPYTAQVPLQIFCYQHLMSNLHLQRLEEAKASARRCLEFMQEGTFNWFKFKEIYLLLLLRVRQYASAGTVLSHALEHARFEFLPDNVKELWRIYESYVYYLTLLEKMTFPMKKKKFKLAKFINEIHIFSKDKGGMNIAILIIKFLSLLHERKYARVLDEVEALEQYNYRHLRGKNTQRSYYFLKMLLQIPAGHFSAREAAAKAERYLHLLKNIPIQLVNQTHEIEIIPYEDLWEYILEFLRKEER